MSCRVPALIQRVQASALVANTNSGAGQHQRSNSRVQVESRGADNIITLSVLPGEASLRVCTERLQKNAVSRSTRRTEV